MAEPAVGMADGDDLMQKSHAMRGPYVLNAGPPLGQMTLAEHHTAHWDPGAWTSYKGCQYHQKGTYADISTAVNLTSRCLRHLTLVLWKSDHAGAAEWVCALKFCSTWHAFFYYSGSTSKSHAGARLLLESMWAMQQPLEKVLHFL